MRHGRHLGITGKEAKSFVGPLASLPSYFCSYKLNTYILIGMNG